ncbi:MAG: class I SAM-dependent methyltransferase [Pedobacter sp.]|nr:class I SAM-dependent methyltransferase [Pedobacter sp.]
MFKKIFGKKPQRPTYSREMFIDSIPKDISILEIGPFYTPLCKGDKVKYLDILDQEAMIKRAESIDAQINTSQIPFIHYVSPQGDLRVAKEKFDAIFSSHVIEHQLDLIGHLQQVSQVLNEGQRYYLNIPDKRYCFDHFHKESTIAEVIDAHLNKRTKHSLKSVIEHRTITHNHPADHWRGQHGEVEDVINKIKNAIDEYQSNDYIDVHAWYFTPESFSGLISLLNELGYIDLKICRLHETPLYGIEFYAVLEKSKS